MFGNEAVSSLLLSSQGFITVPFLFPIPRDINGFKAPLRKLISGLNVSNESVLDSALMQRLPLILPP